MKYLSASCLMGAFTWKPREAAWEVELALVEIIRRERWRWPGGPGGVRCDLLFDVIRKLQEEGGGVLPCSPLSPQHPKQSLAHSGPR